jgi:hypothetical protein
MRAEKRVSAMPEALASVWHNIGGGSRFWSFQSSFRDGPKDQTRNLEIPGSMLRLAPE